MTSSRVTMPPGPVGVTVSRSTPRSLASLRTGGLARTGWTSVRSAWALACAPASAARAALAGAQAKAQAERTDVHPVLAKPPVRKLAKDLGVDLDTVTPTGPGGIVTREDVIARSKENEPRTLATYAMDDKPWLASGTVSDDGRST